MNYIKRMMKTAGVLTRKVKPFYCDKNQGNVPCELCIEKYGKCLSQKEIYPDFTAEKQLEVIKLIGKVKDFNCFFSSSDREWYLSAGLELPISFDLQESDTDFTQALAQLATELMKAGELDKEKVKEVLKR